MKKTAISVFASGRGSNFQAICEAINAKKLDAKVVSLISDQPDAQVIGLAKKFQIPCFVIPKKKSQSREEHESEILALLKIHAPHFIVLAGYMRVLSPLFLKAWYSERGYYRVTNIHPSLLPALPGQSAYAQAFNFGCKITGVTVHLLDECVDTGPICAQEAFEIADAKSILEIEQMGLKLEHRLYPETLSWILKEKFEIKMREGRTCVCKD
ncbi:MAG: phosphoribosylglycinamide formyltransferase [Deltaproteobacteria bacterium]|nr:phosphoribosylglycinamide formyltransferase [Deltaproteobacteria bacterium]